MSNTLIDQVVFQIKKTPKKSATKLVAIDGRGGSGKSSLAKKIKSLDSKIQIVQLDFFPATAEENPFHKLGTQTKVSPSRILNQLLIPLSKGIDAHFTATSWWVNQPSANKEIIITAGDTVIIEGCYSLLPEFQNFYDYKIWVDCPAMSAMERALCRDGGEKDRQVWLEAYLPNEARYIEKYKPHLIADILIDLSEGVTND